MCGKGLTKQNASALNILAQKNKCETDDWNVNIKQCAPSKQTGVDGV